MFQRNESSDERLQNSPVYCLKHINVTDAYDKISYDKVSCGPDKVPKLLLYNLIMLLFLYVCYLTIHWKKVGFEIYRKELCI